MKVSELQEHLKNLNPNAEIDFSFLSENEKWKIYSQLQETLWARVLKQTSNPKITIMTQSLNSKKIDESSLCTCKHKAIQHYWIYNENNNECSLCNCNQFRIK